MEVIKFLPSSSIKLETELTRLGELLVRTSNEFAFDVRVLGMKETKIIDAFIIEFLMTDIKFEFKALLALSDTNSIEIAIENASNLPGELLLHTRSMAIDLGYRIAGFSTLSLAAALKSRLVTAIKTPFHRLRHELKKWQVPAQELPQGQVDFLLAGYYVNNIHVLLPLVDGLKNRGQRILYLATRVETYLDLKKRHTPDLLFVDNSFTDQIKIDFGQLDQFLKLFFSRFPENWKSSKYFERQFRAKLVRRIRQSAGWYIRFREIFEKTTPKRLLLNTGSAPDSRMLIQMAKRRGIPDFVVVHGLFHDTPLLRFQDMSHKFVWSEYQARLINKYNPAVKCIVSGSPKHDALLKKFSQASSDSPYGRPFILFPTTPPNNVLIDQQTYDMVLLEFAYAATQLPDFLFVVKLHPTEKMDSVRATLKKSRLNIENLIVTKTEDTYNLLYHCDLVFAVASTVGLEAFLFQKRVLAYNFNRHEKWYPFTPSSKVMFIDDFTNFVSDIKTLLSAPDVDDAIEREYFFTSGDGINIIEQHLLQEPALP